MDVPLLSSYNGPFDPSVSLASFSRQALARLGREYMLIGHLQDRVGLPLVMQQLGAEAYLQFSIDEWMGASPIYSRRMQRALGFEGCDVGTTFKNLQLEIGAPPQFMDFQFRLDAPDRGEFWLAHCGALLDVEPFGEKQVRTMCHDIEDPTFDATAAATHPCMKVRPIHRPPREPAGRVPHCRWSVFIDEEATPYEQHPNLSLVRAAKIATLPIEVPEAVAEPGGWDDYSGDFDPDFQLEDLCHRALVIVGQEVAVQIHLLARAFMLCAARRRGDDVAAELGRRQWIGAAAIGALRIQRELRVGGDGIDAIAKVFQMHPHFQPRTYVDFRVEVTGHETARISLRDCPALREDTPYSWFATLGPEPHPALDAIAAALNPRARCLPVARPRDAALAWDVVIDRAAEPRAEPPELALGRISRGVDFALEQRRPLRQ